MAWFEKTKPDPDASEKKTLGRGVFRRCDECGETMLAEDFTANLEVCPKCNAHYRLSGEAWIDLLVDRFRAPMAPKTSAAVADVARSPRAPKPPPSV